MVKFSDLGLSEGFVSVLEKLEITKPTEIQEKAIPFILEGRDIVGVSATGSGKTLAFASTIIENVMVRGKPQALILTPTRELAEQIASSIRMFSIRKIKVFAAYGGVKIDEHVKKINKADVIVATPGRLKDLINRSAFGFSEIKTLILDEFDRMLDMGFEKDTASIVKKCYQERQTMLFSATKSKEVESLLGKYVSNPVEVSVKSFVDHSKLEQRYYSMGDTHKFSLLTHLLEYDKGESIIVFCSTKRNTEFVCDNLKRIGFPVRIIHGDIEQKKRTRTIKQFHKDGGILVCTDVAARGLDIRNVSHVYNYDLPRFPEDYIHRVGRTARAGAEGRAVTFVQEKDEEMLIEIKKLQGVALQEMETPNIEKVSMKERSPKEKRAASKKRRRGGEWTSVDDEALSNRERKRSVGRDHKEEESDGGPKKKTRRAGRKRRAQSGGKKVVKHRPAKGKTKKTGRAGTRGKVKKVSRRPKGRANRKTKK